jgi:hypothetical protein
MGAQRLVWAMSSIGCKTASTSISWMCRAGSQDASRQRRDAWIDMHPEIDFELLSTGDRFREQLARQYNHIYLYQFDKTRSPARPGR